MLWQFIFVLFTLFTLRTASSTEKRKLESLKWMHIPKTSSWMGDFLLMFACPHMKARYDLFDHGKVFFYDSVRDDFALLRDCKIRITRGRDGGFGWHDPYLPYISNGTTITLFRNPKERLISAFTFSSGFMIPPGNVYSQNGTLPEHVYYAETPLIAYSKITGIPSCQIKMVMGRYCGADVAMTDMDLIEAKRRVEQDFAFVGEDNYIPCFIGAIFNRYRLNCCI